LAGLAAPVFGGGFSLPGAPGGTGGFAGPVQSVGGANYFGLAQNFLSEQLSRLTTRQFFDVDRGFVSLDRGIGGTAGNALLGAGGALLGYGLKRGGKAGIGLSAGGGALIGARFGGPIGAAIGGAAGAAAGLIRSFFKSATDKAREKIRDVHKVNVRERKILEQVVEVSRSVYGGNLDAAVRGEEITDLIRLYAMSTDQRIGDTLVPARSYGILQSGGGAFLETRPLSGSGFSGTLQPIQASAAPRVETLILQVDGQSAAAVLEGRAGAVIQNNPRLVQRSAVEGQKASAGRRESVATQFAPGWVAG
jgi:hypothetical protein